MALSGGSDDGEPMIEMNVTPLIDVMLVLLIMLIMTLPPITNSVNIDLPVPSNEPPPPNMIDPIKNKIVLTPNNEILWNATVINSAELVRNLNATKNIDPEPELQFEPEGQASYDISAQVLNIIKATGVTKFGFVGNDKYRVFDKDTSGVNPGG